MTASDQVPGSRARWPIASTLGLIVLGAAASYYGVEGLRTIHIVLLLLAALTLSMHLVAKIRVMFDNALISAAHGILVMTALVASTGLGLYLVGWLVDQVPTAVQDLRQSKTLLEGVANALPFVFPLLVLTYPIITLVLIAVLLRSNKFGVQKPRE